MTDAAYLGAPTPGSEAGLPSHVLLSGINSKWLFGGGFLVLAGLSAALAGFMPIGFSIVTVFLFAGPHNWIEARYFLARLPARWGKLRGFFLLAFAGIFGLTAVYAALPWLADVAGWDHETYLSVYAAWNSVLVLWIAALIHLRSRQN